MIIFLNGTDWENPVTAVGPQGEHVFLSAAEGSRIPLHALNVSAWSTHGSDRALDTISVQIPPTDLSDRLQGCTHISFWRHIGMRTFAMGFHRRLGAESPVSALAGNEDVLRLIGKFTGGPAKDNTVL